MPTTSIYTNLLLKSSLFIKVFFLFLFLLLIMVPGQLYHAGILNLMQKVLNANIYIMLLTYTQPLYIFCISSILIDDICISYVNVLKTQS